MSQAPGCAQRTQKDLEVIGAPLTLLSGLAPGTAWLCAGLFFLAATAHAQPVAPAASSPQAQAVTVPDPLGRSTPRGTVLGFLLAERRGDHGAGVQYLNTRLQGEDAAELAHQLFVVLDRGLPARLNELSDRPEGALPFPARPDEDLVGTISSKAGTVDIVVQRVNRKQKGLIWLFSAKTLDAIPGLYEESTEVTVESIIPQFLVRNRIAHIPLFEFVAVFIGLPLLYLLFSLVNWVLSRTAGRLLRSMRRRADLPNPEVVPKPLRLLLIALTIRWAISRVALPLLARGFWSTTSTILTIAAFVWILILVNGAVERAIHRRLLRGQRGGAMAILRLGRRTVDLLWLVAGILGTLHHFGVNLTAAMAGLSIGGIAVALAAQKTLENIIGGISIIFDQVIRVGDHVKVGDHEGDVEDIGLRSTRIRTLDRTLVSVPNGRLATEVLEDVSMRDKFWLHHTLRLRYDTPDTTIRAIVNEIKAHLSEDPRVERSSMRVHFINVGSSTLDIEIYIYVFATDIIQFLDTQQELLLDAMATVSRAGGFVALPSQTLYLAGSKTSDASTTAGKWLSKSQS